MQTLVRKYARGECAQSVGSRATRVVNTGSLELSAGKVFLSGKEVSEALLLYYISVGKNILSWLL